MGWCSKFFLFGSSLGSNLYVSTHDMTRRIVLAHLRESSEFQEDPDHPGFWGLAAQTYAITSPHWAFLAQPPRAYHPPARSIANAPKRPSPLREEITRYIESGEAAIAAMGAAIWGGAGRLRVVRIAREREVDESNLRRDLLKSLCSAK